MNEFSLIETYFKPLKHTRDDIIFGIGDDAACLQVPAGQQLLVSTDTLVANVHFLEAWDAYDIACKAVMSNVSDMAAMGAVPAWLSLALTLPTLDEPWLQRFSQGLSDSIHPFNIALIGGDTTHGPLSITMTIHGFVPIGKAVRRNGAKPGDIVYVSGELGAAALAVEFLQCRDIDHQDQLILLKKLQHPIPRVDLSHELQTFASAAIDISDGLSADLNHICVASGVGATLVLDNIPMHPLVQKYKGADAIDIALGGGDDYELCFTVPSERNAALLTKLAQLGKACYPIGTIETKPGLRAKTFSGATVSLVARGYSHF